LPAQPSGLDLGAPGLTQAELTVWGAAAAIAATRGTAPTVYEEDGASAVGTPPGAGPAVSVDAAHIAPQPRQAPAPSRPVPSTVTAAAVVSTAPEPDLSMAWKAAPASAAAAAAASPANAPFGRPVAATSTVSSSARPKSLLGAKVGAAPQRPAPTAMPMPSSQQQQSASARSAGGSGVDPYAEGYEEGRREVEQALAAQRQQAVVYTEAASARESPDLGRDGGMYSQQQQGGYGAYTVADPQMPAYTDSAAQPAGGGDPAAANKRAALAAVAEAARQRAAARNAARAQVRERAASQRAVGVDDLHQAADAALARYPGSPGAGYRASQPVDSRMTWDSITGNEAVDYYNGDAAGAGGGVNSGWADALADMPPAAVIPTMSAQMPSSAASQLPPSRVLPPPQGQGSGPSRPLLMAGQVSDIRRQELRARVEEAAARAAAAAEEGPSPEAVQAIAARQRARGSTGSPSQQYSPRMANGRPAAPAGSVSNSRTRGGLYGEDD
jgi:hypothetical protein